MNSAPWFRLYHRMIDDEKIRLLAFEDRWHFIAILCLKADGLLDEEESSLKQRKIAVKLGVQLRELDEIKRRLSEVGLVDDDMQPVAWDTLQYKSDNSTDRVRKYREKSKGKIDETECNVSRNVSETPPDTDTDTELTSSLLSDVRARSPEKPNARAELMKVLDEEHAQAVIDHRTRIKKPMTPHAAKLLAGKFARCPDPNAAADAMIANGWQGFEPEWLSRLTSSRRVDPPPKPTAVDAMQQIFREKGWIPDEPELLHSNHDNVELLPPESGGHQGAIADLRDGPRWNTR